MLEELKKPIEELLTAGKDAVSNAARNNEESNIFFEIKARIRCSCNFNNNES